MIPLQPNQAKNTLKGNFDSHNDTNDQLFNESSLQKIEPFDELENFSQESEEHLSNQMVTRHLAKQPKFPPRLRNCYHWHKSYKLAPVSSKLVRRGVMRGWGDGVMEKTEARFPLSPHLPTAPSPNRPTSPSPLPVSNLNN